MIRVAEIGVDSDGMLRPFSEVAEEAKLAGIIALQKGRGVARKALHSALVEAGFGTETLAQFSEHGTNASLPGSVYSLPPYRYALDIGRQALEQVHQASGWSDLLTALAAKLEAEGGVPTVQTDAGETIENDSIIALPGMLSTPLPTPGEWDLFRQIRAEATAVAMDPARLQLLKRDGLRRLLILLLLASGIPLRNLLRYRQYYRFGSFVFVGGLPRYFVALMRQSDCGLGLIPIAIAHSECVARVLEAMKVPCKVTIQRMIFADFDWDRQGRRRSLLEMLPIGSRSQLPKHADRLLERGATLLSLMNIGGFLTTSLRDKLWVPANYYHIGDLLDAKGIPRSTLRGLDGKPWADPYCPSPKAIMRAATMEDLLLLLGTRNASTRGRGRPRTLPPQLLSLGSDHHKWTDQEWATFIAYYWPRPSKARIKQLLENTGGVAETGRWARAARIFERIAKDGRLHSALPLRLIAPAKLTDLLYAVEKIHLPAIAGAKVHFARMVGQLWSFAALGVRPQEARRIAPEDRTEAALFTLLAIHGTKSHRSARRPSVHVFSQGPSGADIFAEWEKVFKAATASATTTVDPVFAISGEGGERYDQINLALRTGFENLVGEKFAADGRDGTYTAYSIRHATIIRIVQAAIDSDFLHGNFQAALALGASSLGHSYPVFLSHYLGTAVLAMKWPALLSPSATALRMPSPKSSR